MTNLNLHAQAQRRYGNQFDGLRERARDLRNRADSLIDLESRVSTSQRNLDARELELNGREQELRRRAAALDDRERKLAQAESVELKTRVDRKLDAARETMGLAAEPRAAAKVFDPAKAGPDKLAAMIVEAGRIRRGEVDAAATPLPSDPHARAAVLCGMLRRAELSGDAEQKAVAELERLTALIMRGQPR